MPIELSYQLPPIWASLVPCQSAQDTYSWLLYVYADECLEINTIHPVRGVAVAPLVRRAPLPRRPGVVGRGQAQAQLAATGIVRQSWSHCRSGRP